MQIIYFSLTLALMWLHFAGVTALAGPRFGSWAIGRAAGVIVIVMIGFCVEHLIGLGSLSLAWPFTTAAALYILWRKREALLAGGFVRGEIVFGIALCFGLTWRVLFPSIYQTAERLPDLMFISSFIGGDTLPPVDHWLPPFKFNYYYSLQYYAAGLAGRILRMPLGVTYNMCIIFLSSMSLSLLWDIASRFIAGKAPRILLVAAIACGGTGISVFNHFTINDKSAGAYNGFMVGSARFIGEYDSTINTDLGRKLFPRVNIPNSMPRALGMENFGYQYFLGEFHAPQSGYFLVFLAIALIAAMETIAADDVRRKRWLQAAMGLSVPAVFAANTWLFPFQAILIGVWALWHAWQGRKDASRKPDWTALIGAGIAGFVLLYPFLVGFSSRASATPIRLVHAIDHTPLPQFLGQFWPLLVLLGLGLWHRDTRRLSLFFALVFGALLICSEVVFVDDPSGDQYERTNTVMKWWGWIWSGGVAALGAVLLGANKRWVRYTATAALAFTLVYAFDIGRYWWFDHEQGGANMFGSNYYTSDPIARDMFKYLASAPDGIMVENQYGDGYHEGGAYGAFSGKPLLVGWTNQLYNWRGYMDIIGQRRRDVNQFYSGEMTQPLQWLLDNDVRYVIWNRRDSYSRDLWARRNGELSPMYAWITFGMEGDRPIGLWVKRNRE